jgi:hypothetical protein
MTTPIHRPQRIVSGGQTGADCGGLDAAIALGIEHGGWCPYGRRAESGRIPDRYKLRETDSVAYSHRTLLNVRDSDASVIFTIGALTPGSMLTHRHARQLTRPFLHVDLSDWFRAEPAAFAAWCAEHKVATLNVAGSRESTASGIQASVRDYLVSAFSAS